MSSIAIITWSSVDKKIFDTDEYFSLYSFVDELPDDINPEDVEYWSLAKQLVRSSEVMTNSSPHSAYFFAAEGFFGAEPSEVKVMVKGVIDSLLSGPYDVIFDSMFFAVRGTYGSSFVKFAKATVEDLLVEVKKQRRVPSGQVFQRHRSLLNWSLKPHRAINLIKNISDEGLSSVLAVDFENYGAAWRAYANF